MGPSVNKHLMVVVGVILFLLLMKSQTILCFTSIFERPQLIQINTITNLALCGLFLSATFRAGKIVTYSISDNNSKQQHIVITTPGK